METKPLIKQPTPRPARGGKALSFESGAGQTIAATLNYEVMVAWHSIASPAAKQRFYREAYPILERGLGDYIDALATVRPEELHHVYEWNSIGTRRLWRAVRQDTNDGFKINYVFLPSTRVAPIDPALKEPGPTGKVVKKSAVFRNKAIIMESGRPVIIRRKTARFLAIPTSRIKDGGSGITFSRGPITVKAPGGGKTTLAFTRNFQSWFVSGNATRYLKASGEYTRLEQRTSRAGNNVPARIRSLGTRGSISPAEIDALAASAVNGL